MWSAGQGLSKEKRQQEELSLQFSYNNCSTEHLELKSHSSDMSYPSFLESKLSAGLMQGLRITAEDFSDATLLQQGGWMGQPPEDPFFFNHAVIVRAAAFTVAFALGCSSPQFEGRNIWLIWRNKVVLFKAKPTNANKCHRPPEICGTLSEHDYSCWKAGARFFVTETWGWQGKAHSYSCWQHTYFHTLNIARRWWSDMWHLSYY